MYANGQFYFSTIFRLFFKNLLHLQILNFAILIIYRIGAGGRFLGVGGTWNLWEEKSAGCEIFASGVFIGFIVYTGVHTIAYFFGPNKYRQYD